MSRFPSPYLGGIVSVVLIFLAVDGTAQPVNVCDRTEQVRIELEEYIGIPDNCEYITASHLLKVTGLSLVRSRITSLKKGDFADLPNLESLRLDHNSLTSLPTGIFDGLPNLQLLRLDNNRLNDLNEDIFDGLSNLQNLFLDYNSLSDLDEDLFEGLSNLQVIDLDYNSFTDLDEDLFEGLSNVTNLFLSNNSLITLPENIFDGLPEGLVVTFFRNPLICMPKKIFDLYMAGTITIYVNVKLEACEEPDVTLLLSPEVIAEGEFTTITASLNSPSLATTTITIFPEAIPPAQDSDYILSENRTLTINAGSKFSTGTVTITAVDDQVEGPEKIVTVSGQMTNEQGGSDPMDETLTILSDQTSKTIELAIEPSVVMENHGSTRVVVTATLETARSVDTPLIILIEDGTAQEGTDYMAVSPLYLDILANQLSATSTFVFTPIVDEIDEPDETVLVTGLTPAQGLQVSEAILTIIKPPPKVTLMLSSEALPETGDHATITAHLSDPLSSEITMRISAAPVFPATDSDYILSSNQTLTIPPGAVTSTGLVTITTVDNEVDEPDKAVILGGQITNEQEVIGPSDVTLKIKDNDEATRVKLMVYPSVVNEDTGNERITVNAMLDVARSTDTDITISVESGISIVGTDFTTVPNQTLTIAARDMDGTGTFTFAPIQDGMDEPEEWARVTGTTPVEGLVVSDATLKLLDSDPTPRVTLELTPDAISEAGESTTVTARLSSASSAETIVNVSALSDSKATSGDYTLSPNVTLRIAPGALSSAGTVTITAVDNPVDSPNKMVVISGQASNPQGVTGPLDVMLTIMDDDKTSTLKVAVNPSEVWENDGRMMVTVTTTLDTPRSEDTDVTISIVDGTASAGNDYLASPSTLHLTILADQITNSATFDLTLLDDLIYESEESITINGRSSALERTETRTSLTILDDDELITLTIMDLTIQEDVGIAQVPLEVSPAAPTALIVPYQTIEQSAIEGQDYSLSQGQLTIPVGNTTAIIEVPILDDPLMEPAETFIVRLSEVAGTARDPGEATVTIEDDDVYQLRVEDASALESDRELTFTVQLNPPHPSQTVRVKYETHDGTATATMDYQASHGTLEFSPGMVSRQVSIPLLDDTIEESEETFLFQLSAPEHAALSDVTEARGTIQDDDGEPTVSIYDQEGAEGAGSLLLPVRLSRPSSQLVTVQFASSDGTANAGSDFVTSQGIVIFQRGSTEGKIRIQILEDSEVEADETFRVTLSNARHARIAQETGIGTILDNDGSPTVSVQSVSVSRSVAVFELNLSTSSALPVVVSYASQDGSALAGKDYKPVAGQVIFAPGDVSKTIEVKLLANEPVWQAKTFALVVLSAVNAEVEQARTEAVMEEESEESVQKAYVSRVLRTWASQVVEALSRRMEGMAQCHIPDLSLLHNGTEQRSLGQIFSGCGAEFTQGGWSVWGQGAFTRIRGTDGALSLSSDVTTMLVGADYVWSQGWMAGLLAAQSWDQGTYETPARSGTASSRLTSFYPYVSYQTGAGMRAWILLGLGRGETEVETLESELDASLVALGLTGTLTGSTTGRLGYEVDAFWTTADMENGSDLVVRRIRAGVEGNLRLGQSMQPYLKAALRQDGGDAETGMGMELGGGMRWSTSRLRAEFSGRTLVVHTDEGLREWGLMGSIEYGAPSGVGPLMRVRPLWGNVDGGELWREAPLQFSGLGRTDQRVEMELGYGTPIKKSLGRSIVGMTVDSMGQTYRVGYHLRMREGMQFSVATTARTMETDGPPYSYGLSAHMDLKW